MRGIGLLGTLSCVLHLAAGQAGPDEFDRLVRSLGSEDPAVRDGATRRLLRVAPSNLDRLRSAYAAAEDPETRDRLESILRAITPAIEWYRFRIQIQPRFSTLDEPRFNVRVEGQGPIVVCRRAFHVRILTASGDSLSPLFSEPSPDPPAVGCRLSEADFVSGRGSISIGPVGFSNVDLAAPVRAYRLGETGRYRIEITYRYSSDRYVRQCGCRRKDRHGHPDLPWNLALSGETTFGEDFEMAQPRLARVCHVSQNHEPDTYVDLREEKDLAELQRRFARATVVRATEREMVGKRGFRVFTSGMAGMPEHFLVWGGMIQIREGDVLLDRQGLEGWLTRTFDSRIASR